MEPTKNALDILIAEDEAPNRALYQRFLQIKGGHNVKFAVTAENAIELLEARISEGNIPDYVITDNRFTETGGHKTGLDVIAYLLDKLPDHSQRPHILFVSGTEGQPEIEKLCIDKFGTYDPLTQRIEALRKPFEFKDLLARINAHRDSL